MAGNFLTGCVTVSFWRTLLHGVSYFTHSALSVDMSEAQLTNNCRVGVDKGTPDNYGCQNTVKRQEGCGWLWEDAGSNYLACSMFEWFRVSVPVIVTNRKKRHSEKCIHLFLLPDFLHPIRGARLTLPALCFLRSWRSLRYKFGAHLPVSAGA
jgi:hypothetical protein